MLNVVRKPASRPEFLVGGIALVTVALIAFGGMPFAQPWKTLPAPRHYASVLIEPSEALAKLSLEQPLELADVTGATHDAQSPDTRFDIGNSTPARSIPTDLYGAQPRPFTNERSAAPDVDWPIGLHVQEHGIEVDSQGAFADVIRAPPSSGSLLDPPPANSRLHSVPGAPTLHADPSFIGGWRDAAGRCRTSRKAPLVINFRAAKTANGECDFGFVAREAANRWRLTAICAAGGNFWRANIALKLTEPKLTWSSERGTETYVRCKI